LKRRAGRPARGKAAVTPGTILDAALALLDAGGSGALTMRALGLRLKVNPMTIHHHFGGRDGLIAALGDRVYADVSPPADLSARRRLEGLLRAYREQVRRHPALTLEVFQSPAAFPAQARRISELLVALLSELGLSHARAVLWRDVLVDYLHGAALAEALSALPDAPSGSAPEDPLGELIATVLSVEARGRTSVGFQ